MAVDDLGKIKETQQVQGVPQVPQQINYYILQSLLKTQRMNSHFTDDLALSNDNNIKSFHEFLTDTHIAQNDPLKPSSLIQFNEDLSVNKKSAPAPQSNKTSETLITEFVGTLWSKASHAAALIGLDPKLLIAQAALETGWGRSIIKNTDGSSSNNLFNIKSKFKEEAVTVVTTEYEIGNVIKTYGTFKTYASIEASFKDYITFITTNKRYQTALANTQEPERYIQELSKAGYATDPEYSSKIINIYHSKELNQALAEYVGRAV